MNRKPGIFAAVLRARKAVSDFVPQIADIRLVTEAQYLTPRRNWNRKGGGGEDIDLASARGDPHYYFALREYLFFNWQITLNLTFRRKVGGNQWIIYHVIHISFRRPLEYSQFSSPLFLENLLGIVALNDNWIFPLSVEFESSY